MYLTKLKEISENWCGSKVTDVVIGVPSSFRDVHRQAVMDAAKIAGLSVLRVMNEHTATALSYGIYRSNDFHAETPCTVAFCSAGHSIFSVSVVQFIKGKLTILCEKSEKVGGRDMDECLMREFAAQFKKKVGADPISSKKALFKLEDAVGKTKKTLSANAEAGVNVECLMEDEDFASNITRTDLEKMCEPMIEKMQAVLDAAKAEMGIPVDQIDFVEMVGGAHRVPFVKKMCSDAFGGKDLSFTMNAEESVCRGCALQAAMLSPLFKVRDFRVEDTTPIGISVGWRGSSSDVAAAAEETTQDGEPEISMTGSEGEYKTAVVFPAGSMLNLVKVLTFFRKESFDITAEYVDSPLLGQTSKSLGNYRIELPVQTEAKKVKVRAKLNLHGIFQIEGAQLVEEEEYEEKVKEKRELPVEETKEAEAPAEAPAEKTPEAEAAEGEAKEAAKTEEKKEPEKKYEWVEVVKKKKRTKRTDLVISTSGMLGLSDAEVQRQMDAETAMQAEMKEIIETNERRNDLESYIFNMRDKIAEGNDYGEFISSADRDKFNSDLTKAEDWLYDTYEGTKTQFVEKLDELKQTGESVAWRKREHGMRDDWIAAVTGTIANYRGAAENPGDKYGHIAPEKLAKIVEQCVDLEKWLNDMKAKQESTPKSERPVLICADMEKKNQELAKMADDILKEPKPAPPKEEKKPDVAAADDAKGDDAAAEEAKEPDAAQGPQNMDVD
jgi:heat shock protein 4